MDVSKAEVKKRIEAKDYHGLSQLLAKHPHLANEGITIPYDPFCTAKAHPLHRICDGVMARKLTEDEAIRLAAILLDKGANIDGDKHKGEGTPLLAAASLHAEQVGIFYIDQGADVHYTYEKGGASALHWAAFCGRDRLVERIIQAGAATDEPDTEHNSTPLAWALHALMTNDTRNAHHQMDCIKLLLKAGAAMQKLNEEAKDYLITLAKEDPELQKLLL